MNENKITDVFFLFSFQLLLVLQNRVIYLLVPVESVVFQIKSKTIDYVSFLIVLIH